MATEPTGGRGARRRSGHGPVHAVGGPTTSIGGVAMRGSTLLRRGIPIVAAAWSLAITTSWSRPARADVFLSTNLVSDDLSANPAVLMDPNLKNAWGISSTGTSPFWVSSNGAGVSTLYRVSP